MHVNWENSQEKVKMTFSYSYSVNCGQQARLVFLSSFLSPRSSSHVLHVSHLLLSFFFLFLVCARFISWHLAVLANLCLFLFPLFPLITLSLRSSFYLYFELSTRSYLLVTGLSTLSPLSLLQISYFLFLEISFRV